MYFCGHLWTGLHTPSFWLLGQRPLDWILNPLVDEDRASCLALTVLSPDPAQVTAWWRLVRGDGQGTRALLVSTHLS